ncbi:MAG TPA: hypothetical protein VGN00_09400 [Puia sp.]|jgi:hypothetical protein
MIIKIEYVERIRRDDDLLLILAKANGVRVTSIERWLRKNNKILTTAENLGILSKHLRVDATGLLQEDKKIAEAK